MAEAGAEAPPEDGEEMELSLNTPTSEGVDLALPSPGGLHKLETAERGDTRLLGKPASSPPPRSSAMSLPGILRRVSTGASGSAVVRLRTTASSTSSSPTESTTPTGLSRVASDGCERDMRRKDSTILTRARLQRAYTTGCEGASTDLDLSPLGPPRKVKSGDSLGSPDLPPRADSASPTLWRRFQRSLSPKSLASPTSRSGRSRGNRLDRVKSLLSFGKSPVPDDESSESPSPVKRVGFCSPAKNTTHEVTPYARKYGVHPSFFYFSRRGDKQLTDTGIVEEMRRKEEGLAPLKLDADLS
ncbi:unnamed protein product [Prorocentrum cordatum]|uniref:Uncharacterized protein n=1 Tax=Prorocentrum cordatum TaxID=2364126 RepID=A0ABN9S6J5_9DINO|nr:unnamed protein product [Polarella glacialis]